MFFFFSSRRRHTRCYRDWSSDVCSSDLGSERAVLGAAKAQHVNMTGDVSKLAAEMGDCIGQARAVQVQPQVAGTAEFGEVVQLPERVAGAELGHLGNGDGTRLSTVLVPPAGQAAGYQAGR